MKKSRLIRLLTLVLTILMIVPFNTGAAGASDFSGVTIEYAGCFNEVEPHGQWIVAMAKAWEEKTGGTIKLNLIGRDVLTQVKSRILADDAPDIIDQDFSELQAAFLTNEVMLEPLDSVLNSVAEGDNAPLKDQLNDGYAMYTLDGVNYFVPYISITAGFFYDKAMFADNNIAIPETWDEFIAICQALKDLDYPPLTLDGQISFYNAYYFAYACQRVMGTGAFWAAATDPTGAAWDDPGYLKAAELVAELSKSGKDFFQPGYEGSAYPTGQGEWAMGLYGMVYCGTWIPAETNAQTGPDFEYGFFPFPAVPGGKGSRNEVEMMTMGFCVPKNAKNIEAAKDFILFCMSKENADAFVKTTANLSPRLDAVAPQYLDDAMAYLNDVTGFFMNYDGVMAGAPEWWANVFYPADNALVFGTATAEEFIAQIKAESIKFYANK